MLLKTMFVRAMESIGTTSWIGSIVLSAPASLISTRTASGRLVFNEVTSLVSQVSFQRAPSKQENFTLATPLNMS